MGFASRGTWALVVALLAGATGTPALASEPRASEQLPRYDLAVRLDTAARRATVRERVTWTNTTSKPVSHLAFNYYPHYVVPQGDYVLLAKTLELLRLQPSLGIDRIGRHGVVDSARLIAPDGKDSPLNYEFDADNMTTLRFPLPKPVEPGKSVTVELDCTLHLPNKQGRWGQWEGVTFLTNALPMLAFCDDSGWRPMPFVPWAQPWFNEAGHFRATIDLPENELLACSAQVKSETLLGDGWKRVETQPFVGRDFALLCSARYREYRGEAKMPDGRTVALKCLAFPEHEFYATEILKIVGEAIGIFSQWFGPFPYPQFTIAESYFGWNGNECAGLVMIDERVFAMPHLARGYVEYLVSHETCHQWWYNLLGTNGYAEPFIDEGAAVFFTHKMLDQKVGKNNAFFDWPDGLKWLPQVYRDNYRHSGMALAVRNKDLQPAAQDLPRYGHLIGLFNGAYDRGSKVYAMIEERLGEAAFLDFVRLLFAKYGWRVMQAADLKRELEAYTGRDWSEFFDRWVYGKGMTDWSVESVTVDAGRRFVPGRPQAVRTATVLVRQSREHTESTTIAVRLTSGETVHLPLWPTDRPLAIPESQARIEPAGDRTWRVSFDVPADVEQVTIDPERILLDAHPGNNVWKSDPKVRFTPLYTVLDDNDLAADYDRWNFNLGPWMWGATYADPWYTRSTMIGLRAGAYRTQRFQGGAYAAYRTDYRDAVLGVDATWLWEMQQTGVNWEYRIGGPWGGQEGASAPQRASLYHRWVVKQGSSLYLPQMVYHETFVTYQDNFLPFPRNTTPGSVRWGEQWTWGWHFRANLYTPYWDPECGFWADAMVGVGEARMPSWLTTGQFRGELAGVKQLPDWAGPLRHARVAGRVVAMGALPDQGQFYPLGGGTLFRGYDLAERQGSVLWVANAELRYPVARDVQWDCLDHCIGARNVWLAAFYDVGDVYANGRSVGGRVAHALGAGLRVDLAVFSFIERATMRFEFAKTINDNTPFQFWFGITQPF